MAKPSRAMPCGESTRRDVTLNDAHSSFYIGPNSRRPPLLLLLLLLLLLKLRVERKEKSGNKKTIRPRFRDTTEMIGFSATIDEVDRPRLVLNKSPAPCRVLPCCTTPRASMASKEKRDAGGGHPAHTTLSLSQFLHL